MKKSLYGERDYAFGQLMLTLRTTTRETTRCSFAEVIEVTPSQIEETGVSRFECPTCLAVREIKPKGGRVKFPSHPKRLTRTPNQGSRWVKRESAWKRFGT